MRLSALIFLLSAMPALADVPPEVPTSRTSQIFSPFFFSFHDDGEGVFTSAGPHCLDYAVINDLRQNVAPVDGVSAQAGLEGLAAELNTTTGLQFFSSHGSTAPSLGVEAFSTDDVALADAVAQLDAYQHNGQPWAPSGTEASIRVTPDGYYDISVIPGYISRVLSGTTHSIVFNSACDSFYSRSGFAGSAVRGYLGYSDTCDTGSGDAQAIFDTMSGARAINSAYQNFALATAFQVTQAQTSILSFQPNTQSANGLRLYNAPRIVFSQVTQDSAGDGSFSTSLYNYPPGASFAGSYPYGSGTTNYPGAPGTSGFAKTGSVLINLRFSEPMDPSWSSFQVQLQFADGTTQDVTSGGQWRTNVLPNDSWSVTTTLPSGGHDGKVVVAVRASKTPCGGQDVNNQELDTTGSGSSVAGTYDLSTSFTIDNLALTVYPDAV